MIKQIFCDLETTGSDYLKHGVYQIGGVIRYPGVHEEFELSCDIFQEDEIDPVAFEKAAIKPEDLIKLPDPCQTYQKFIALLGQHCDKYNPQDKFFFLNFGAEFDSKFLRRWFESNGDQYYGSFFWHPPVEIQSLAAEFLKERRHTMKNFKLSTVCQECGIEVDETKTHTALYDGQLAMRLYDHITQYRR